VILIDANVPMYLIGAEHPHKIAAQRQLERAATNRDRLVTDAEVFQEILHRYTAIGRRDAIQPAFDLLNAVIDEVFAIEGATVERAKDLLLGYGRLSARDAIHVAAMQAHGVSRIMSFDAAFDVVPGLARLPSP
jgi:predicted nucleic acid-binding protein